MLNSKLNTALGALCLMVIAWHSQAQEDSVDETQIIASDLEPDTQNPSTEATAKETQRVDAHYLTQRAQELLAEANIEAESMWLNSSESFVAFWSDDQSGAPLGALLLLHDQSQSPIWPETLQNIHRYLPRFGWAALSIELKNLPPEPIPERQISEVTAVSTDSQTETQPPANNTGAATTEAMGEGKEETKIDETEVVHQDEEAKSLAGAPPAPDSPKPPMKPLPTVAEVFTDNHARVSAAVEFLHQQSQYNIVLVGVGLGGYQSLRFVAENDLTPPEVENKTDDQSNTTRKALINRAIRALVLVNVKNEYDKRLTQTAPELMTQPGIPIMDITTQFDDILQANLDERNRVAKKNRYELYRKKHLTPPNGISYNHHESELTKVIRGFVTRFAAGNEL